MVVCHRAYVWFSLQEVVAFAGLTTDGMVSKLCETISKAKIDEYYQAMFPEFPEGDNATEEGLAGDEETPAEVPDENLLRAVPDKNKIEAIVAKLDTSGDGRLQAREVQVLFSQLLEIPVEDIPEDHKEVQTFSGLSTNEMVEVLASTVTPDTVDRYYKALFPVKLMDTPVADRAKVERLVTFLDTSGDGVLSAGEVKHLFSRLHGVSVEDIPDDHKDVAAYSGMSTEALVTHLCTGVGKDKVDEYYSLIFEDVSPPEAEPKLTGYSEPPESEEPKEVTIEDAVALLPKEGAVSVTSRGHFEAGVFVEQVDSEEEKDEAEWEEVQTMQSPSKARLRLDHVKKVNHM